MYTKPLLYMIQKPLEEVNFIYPRGISELSRIAELDSIYLYK